MLTGTSTATTWELPSKVGGRSAAGRAARGGVRISRRPGSQERKLEGERIVSSLRWPWKFMVLPGWPPVQLRLGKEGVPAEPEGLVAGQARQGRELGSRR